MFRPAFVPTTAPSVRNSGTSLSRSSFLSLRNPAKFCNQAIRSSRLHVHTAPLKSSTVVSAVAAQPLTGKRVLVIGGTRFSGLYLVHELANRGANVVVLNRGSKPVGDPSLKVPGETDEHFKERNDRTTQIVADRTDAEALTSALASEKFDVIFDNNGRELSDSKPLADLAKKMDAHFVYMSSAGVYLKAPVMPHIEGDEVDPNCRHKGKLNTEDYLRETDVTYTAIRPTYIYGAGNYNPLDQWFFERLDKGMPICVPGHGAHLTGLGHVRDLAAAMAACACNPVSFGQVYNVQDRRAVTFDGVARLCAKAMGKPEPEIIHYNPKDMDFGKKKAFPFRPQHFFCSPNKALRELDWEVEYDLMAGLKDAYENDFLLKKERGGLKNDFTTDDIILSTVKGASVV
ncbi:similar to mRNA binding protein CSP41 precursor [Chondrus crispus]|uniref:Similar to mRNA binding protein CSP41 n=1 Tax=Chondrus crispus TaxID=2769 RepID=R7QCU1_CHOCR|nr:similar to mRNA binding protein CSP41 precursor [Chondrus crispus]CDF35251.1 similar to mRNA binding protein CSP41 precursor [Chondrus crispus]|eukprot:XP_005715070.1 similar to mRNA binding protein CSP41 precursor [Chondrus crispus]